MFGSRLDRGRRSSVFQVHIDHQFRQVVESPVGALIPQLQHSQEVLVYFSACAATGGPLRGSGR